MQVDSIFMYRRRWYQSYSSFYFSLLNTSYQSTDFRLAHYSNLAIFKTSRYTNKDPIVALVQSSGSRTKESEYSYYGNAFANEYWGYNNMWAAQQWWSAWVTGYYFEFTKIWLNEVMFQLFGSGSRLNLAPREARFPLL